MRTARARLINAARRSMIQRAALQRKIDVARDELAPRALIGRGKYRAQEKLDDAAHAVREQLRTNRVPIALAAAAGIAWVFREPIKTHAPRLGRKLYDLAGGAIDQLRRATGAAGTETTEEEIDETAA